MSIKRFSRFWQRATLIIAEAYPSFLNPARLRAQDAAPPWGNRQMPIIEDLAAAQSNFERAEWLLATPLAILYQHSIQIREVLSAAGYAKGHNYVLLVFATLSMRRDLDGNIRRPMHTALEQAIEDLREDAERPPLSPPCDQLHTFVERLPLLGEEELFWNALRLHKMRQSAHPPKASEEEIARAMGLPPEMIGRGDHSTLGIAFDWPEPKNQTTS